MKEEVKRGRPKYENTEDMLIIKKKSLSKYAEIIDMYKHHFIDYIEEYEDRKNCDDIFDEREQLDRNTKQCLEGFMKLSDWKQNLFIVWLYYKKKFNEMATELNVDRYTLIRTINKIKKEVKWIL